MLDVKCIEFLASLLPYDLANISVAVSWAVFLYFVNTSMCICIAFILSKSVYVSAK